MSLLPIITLPDPILRQKSTPVERVDDELRRTLDDMLETMYDAPGIGLAAPQIGQTIRMFVMDCAAREEEPGSERPMVLINPEITWSSEETAPYEEGCLSIPDQYAEVIRPAAVRVRYHDVAGAENEEEFDGIWATCAQHEIDHLNGKLFIDYLSAVKRAMITNKMKKLKKERARA